LRVHATPGSTWQLTSGDLYVQDLSWDPGTSPGGSTNLSQPASAAGEYFFRVTSRTSAYGAWRSALNVSGGEADLFLQKNSVPLGDTTYKSAQTGSDGVILSPGEFNDNETWYIRVHASAGASWNILSGDIYVRDLGTLSDAGSSVPVQIGPEGTYYFKNSVDANTPAWRLWLNGSSNQIYVSRGKAPIKSAWTEQAEQAETGQALLVPPYLTSAVYIVGVKGSPGSSFTLESRKQPILIPSAVAGYLQGGGAANFDFTLSSQGNAGGFGYLTYRIEVPVQQIAWQVNVTPGSASQNPELYLRKGEVPNRWMNSAFSEAPAGVVDSITQVPPTLTDGAWYVTVYGSGSYTFSLSSSNPVITGATFINTSDPNPVPAGYSYPYKTVPLPNGAQFANQSGWRYYQVSDINSQLGFLGWQLDLANQVPNSEIALRRNAVPARWNFRSGGSSYSTYAQESSHVDLSSTLGLLQQPGHAADIWYMGVYTPNNALGDFQLTTREIPSPLNDFSQSSVPVANQNPSSWRWFKYSVPSDGSLKGWDLRLKVTAGAPRMVVRRDQLPGDFTTTTVYPYYYPLYQLNSWGSGSQWGAAPGEDWTGRNYLTYSPTYTADKNGYLVMGLGSPLEPGTYYVGVSQNGGSDTTPLSYTLESRGIGLAGSSYPVKVQDLDFAGGVANGTSLAPREAGWYRVVVPADSTSWSLNLVPTQGEALLAVRQGRLPNTMAGWNSDDAYRYPGAKRQKSGSDYFYKYPPNGNTAISAGEYYVAVISEGQNPASGSTIGTGGVNYTLTSVGAMPVDDKTATPVAVGSMLSWNRQSLPFGAQKVYRFRVPAGLTSVEVRFKNKVGNPILAVHQDAAGAGKIPYTQLSGSYRAGEDGSNPGWTNFTYSPPCPNVVTIASPVAGEYTVTVAADALAPDTPDASFDLEVEGMGTVDLNFASDSKGITAQDPQTWRYFKVVVPSDAALKGWDLRLKVTAGAPRMVVRRDQLPGDFTTTTVYPYYYPLYQLNSWGSGSQWGAAPGEDWTGRNYLTYSPTYSTDKNGYLVMGLGSPLEPGSYYVGVSQNGGSDTTPMSYTLESRGIGLAGSSYPIKVQDLAFAGGVANGSSLAPREAGWYRVVVPADGASWSLNLVPTQGEALLAVRQGRLPNTMAGWSSDETSRYPGAKRQKSGSDYFYKYPANGNAAISAGEYYVAVISEGQNPVNGSTIGTGGVNYTLTSVGAMPVADRTATPVAVGSVLNWDGQSLPFGAQKVYRFRVPAGLTSVEVRFKNKVGNPILAVRQDAAGAGKIPYTQLSGSYRAGEDGSTPGWTNFSYSPPCPNVVTIASPVAGDYTVTVAADALAPNTPDASFDLEVEGMGTVDLNFASDSKGITAQDPQTWRYFKVVVPSDAALKGWDLRLKVTAGAPRMVVRRDQLPGDFTTTTVYPYYYPLYQLNSWASGSQWGAAPGEDWTGRNYLTYSPTYSTDKNGYLIMGLGSPLEPGTYYVGVSQNGGSDTTPMSYTLESRGIGLAGSSYPIKVQDLAFAGGVANGSNLAPREAGWYRIVVPADGTSWSLNLVPTRGEALLAVRQGRLPNIAPTPYYPSDQTNNYSGVKRQKSGAEYFYKYPVNGNAAITSGEYYVAVISEGENPANSSTIGTGSVDYTLTSVGAMPVADRTATPVAAGSVVSWNAQSLPFGAQKAYRFRVPEGLTSVEVRFKNKVGNPILAVRQDAAGAGKIPYTQLTGSYRAGEDGSTPGWTNFAYVPPLPDLVTIASPAVGDYTVTVVADALSANAPDASYDLEVTALTPVAIPLSTVAPVTGHLIDQQVAYYQVEIPAQVNGYDIAGWKIKTSATSGAASLRVAKGRVPGGGTPALSTAAPVTIVAPPYLSPGTWFVEVNGAGITDYAITSDIISADPAKHQRSWTMPDRNNLAASGAPFSFPAGLSAPEIGDSGIDPQGNPIINPSTGDQGTDLARDDWHFYRIVVPANNGGHLKTVVEALSGTPHLYLRAGDAPSPYHKNHPSDPNYSYAQPAYDRGQSVSGTMYGNWVPLDRRAELQLKPGEWWIGINAVGSNIRYRLKTAAGNVRNADAPVDSADGQLRVFQDLKQSGGSYTGQNLAAGNMRYYRVTVPASSTTQGSSTPLEWTLSLQQQVGDVVILLRDSIPPGQGSDGDIAKNLYYAGSLSPYFQDWYDDNSYLSPNPYLALDAPGAHTLSLPPLRPGATYYLGVYAKTDATFDLSSTVGADRLKLDGVIPFAAGNLSATLAAGETRLYRVDVPADAVVWHHSAVHDGGIRFYLSQGTVPPRDGYANWSSYGNANSSLNQNLTESPWQPGNTYYLLAQNTTGAALPFSLAMSGKSELSRLTVNVVGNCPGSSMITSPNLLTCTSGTCSADITPYTGIYLRAAPGPGCGVTITGACTGGCSIDMASPVTVTATFTDVSGPAITAFSVPATSRIATVPVSFEAFDNLAVTGYCLSELGSSAGCSWQTAPPSSYSFTGLADNTPTGRWLYAYARDAAGNVGSNSAYVTVTVTEARLTVNLSGAGSGSVNSTPSGIACTGGSCSHDYALGSLVTLLQAGGAGSRFAGWSGACTGSGTCAVTMSAARSVTASFDLLPPVRIAGALPVYYATLQAAYDAAKSGDVIQLKEGVLAGKLAANRAITVTVKGGFDSSYATNRGGVTVIEHPVLVRLGKVLSERIAVR
jgi:large repetitive protein